MNNLDTPTTISRNQQGIVSIMVTAVLMTLLTLIVLSFANISRREQRNALDRQLSTQAFYAAESGINDARKVIENWISTSDSKLDNEYMTSCNGFAADAGISLPKKLNASSSAAYTCLFVDPSPPKLVFTKSDDQHVIPIKAKGANVEAIEIYWDDASGGTTFSGCPLPNTNPLNWPADCDAPIVRVELVSAADARSLADGKVLFLYPSTSGGSVDLNASVTGRVAAATCTSSSTPNRCKMIIDVPDLPEGYYMRIKSIYGAAAITITLNNGAAELVGAQVLIDSTGIAADVERRIQVRVKASDLSGDVPKYGLEGTDKICKKFSLGGGSDATDSGLCSTPFPD